MVGSKDQVPEQQPQDSAADATGDTSRPGQSPTAHTEVRNVSRTPRPRARILPPELREDDDDLFNDMPV